MRILHYAMLPLALNGCTTVEATAPEEPARKAPEASCDASGLQGHIGHKASERSGAILLELSGARMLRWIPPRSAVTMDYRPDRLNVSYDDDMSVTRIHCG